MEHIVKKLSVKADHIIISNTLYETVMQYEVKAKPQALLKRTISTIRAMPPLAEDIALIFAINPFSALSLTHAQGRILSLQAALQIQAQDRPMHLLSVLFYVFS